MQQIALRHSFGKKGRNIEYVDMPNVENYLDKEKGNKDT